MRREDAIASVSTEPQLAFQRNKIVLKGDSEHLRPNEEDSMTHRSLYLRTTSARSCRVVTINSCVFPNSRRDIIQSSVVDGV